MTDVKTLIGEMTVKVKISEAQTDMLRWGNHPRHLDAGTHRLSVEECLSLARYCRSQAKKMWGPRAASAAALARNCVRAMNEAAVTCRSLARQLEGKAREI